MASVGGPGRPVLDVVRGGEAARVPDDRVALGLRARRFGEVRGPETVERGEYQPRAVRRGARAADLGDGQDRVVDGIVELDKRTHFLLDVGREGDLRGLARRHLDPHDPAAVKGDQRAGVGRPRPAGIHVPVAHAPALGLVALHVHDKPALFAGLEVEQLERLARVVAGGIDEPAPVRAGHGTEGALVLVRAHHDAPRLAVEHADLEGADLPRRALLHGAEVAGRIRVEVERVRVAGVGAGGGTVHREAAAQVPAHVHPDVPRIRSERGAGVRGGAPAATRPASRATIATLPRDLHPRPAVLVPQPELRALVRHHVLAVRRPHRRHVVVALGVGELARVAAVGVRHPDVLGAVPVAHEDDPGAVGRVARLHVVALPARDAGRVPARDRDRVQVAEQLEDDGFAVRREVERDPRPLVGREIEGARGDERERVRPAGGPCRAVVLLDRLGCGDVSRHTRRRNQHHGRQGGNVPQLQWPHCHLLNLLSAASRSG